MPEEILSGSLKHVPFPALLQIIDTESLTGDLFIGASTGRVGARRGSIVSASYEDLRGVPAVCAMFLVDELRFRFEEPTRELVGDAMAPTMALVMEGLRVMDEWARLSPMVFKPSDDWNPKGPLAAVGALLDGERPLAEAVVLSRALPTTLVDSVLAALDSDELAVCAAPKPERAANAHKLLDVDVLELILEARAHIKRREFDLAETLLRRALAVDPDHRIARQNLRRLVTLRHDQR